MEYIIYVLLVATWNGAGFVHTHEFNSKDACIHAANWYNDTSNRMRIVGGKATCIADKRKH